MAYREFLSSAQRTRDFDKSKLPKSDFLDLAM